MKRTLFGALLSAGILGSGAEAAQQGPGDLSTVEPGYGVSGRALPPPQAGGYPKRYPSEADMNTPAPGAAAGWNANVR